MSRVRIPSLPILCATPVLSMALAFPVAAESDASAPGAASAEQSEPMETKQAAQNAYASKVVCRQQVVIGSRIPRTVCMTRAQMDARRDAAKKWKNDVDKMPRTVPPRG